MFLDSIHGTIDRRILLNYRVDPAVLQRVIPSQFRPKLYRGYGIAGVCMIRFRALRPRYVPAFLGINSENAAHRIAVEWDQDGAKLEGVFIPRRDTGSSFNKALGGRVFPGIFRQSQFISKDSGDHFSLKVLRNDGQPQIDFAGHVARALPDTSIFPSTDEASRFFARGATGYSTTHSPDHFHGMELHCLDWNIEPLSIDRAQAAFYDDRELFPEGSITLDCALVMRKIEHQWHSRPDLWISREGRCLTSRRTER